MNTPPHETPTQALYRAALGPVQREHHLRVFEDFDAVGRARPRWNGLAALCTFNWLIYRRLWRIAALYGLWVAGVVGVLWGLAWGRWPQGVTLGLAAALFVLSTVVPGLFANTWLHGQLRLALVDAVRQAPSMTDAADALRRRAPSLSRLWVLCLINLLLLAVLVFWGKQHRATEPVGLAQSQAPAETSTTSTVTEAVNVPLPASEPAPSELPDASAPRMAAAAPATTASAPYAQVAPASPSVGDAPAAVAEAPEPDARSVSEPIAVPGMLARAKASPQAARSGYGVNVGLFADPANAQRTLARVRQAGVPARSDTLQMERGPRTRVRAGPFESRAQAEKAAGRIRALGLEAQVLKLDASE